MYKLSGRMVEATTLLDHTQRIDYNRGSTALRMTGIIATIGPSCRDEETIFKMLRAGMDVVRINFAYESHVEHSLSLKLLKRAEKRYSKERGYNFVVGIVGDLKGREIRIGTFLVKDFVKLNRGDVLKLVTDHSFYNKSTKDIIYVDYEGFIGEVKAGMKVFFDGPKIRLRIRTVNPDSVECKVLLGGKLKNRVNVIVPEAKFSLPVLSAKDKYDIRFCLKHNVHYLMLSNIYSVGDVVDIRNTLGEEGAHLKLITKIENGRALAGFDEIANVSDAIVISRIDLSIELKIGRVFLTQKSLIPHCNALGKPIIIGPQVLMSMIDSPVPYRSEFADIGGRILDGADFIMLTCVTAVGKFPVEAVKACADCCHESEVAEWHSKSYTNLYTYSDSSVGIKEATSLSAVMTSYNVDAAAIIVVAVSGKAAVLMSNYRPKCPIIAITHCDEVARKIQMYRGVIPINRALKTSDYQKTLEDDMDFALNVANQMGIVKNSDVVVLVTPCEETMSFANNVKTVFVYFDKNVVECVTQKRVHLVDRLK